MAESTVDAIREMEEERRTANTFPPRRKKFKRKFRLMMNFIKEREGEEGLIPFKEGNQGSLDVDLGGRRGVVDEIGEVTTCPASKSE